METKFVIQNVWLADDDRDDQELFEDAITQIVPSVNLKIISNGEKLMDLLITEPVPDMLFLDINMPCKNGIDCLKEIREDRKLFKMPIVIFSSSCQPIHINASYGNGANLYYAKPDSFNELIAELGVILKMDWSDPFTITSQHYISNKFKAFNILYVE